jgi:hypothetical protein
MRISDVWESLPILFKAKVTPFIWGPHGLGKSSIILQYAKANGYDLIELRLGQLEVGDLLGLPEIVRGEKGDAGKGFTRYFQPNWFPQEGTTKKGILFLDELNRARIDVLQAIFQLVLDRKLHTYQLPATWEIICAGNPNVSEYDVTELDKALMDRFCHIKLSPGVEEWLDYSDKTKAHPAVVDFIKQYPHMLDCEVSNFALEIKPSRRSNTMLSDILNAGLPENLIPEIAMGLIGSSATIAFMETLNQVDKPLKADDIMNHFTNGEVQTRIKKFADKKKPRFDLLKITADDLIGYVRKLNNKNQTVEGSQEKNIIEFIKMLPRELAFGIMKELGAIGKWLETMSEDADLVKIINESHIA